MLPAFSSLIFTSCDRISATEHALACNGYHVIPTPHPYDIQTTCRVFFFFGLTVRLSIILVINQLNAQIPLLQQVYHMPLHVSSTVVLIIRRSKLYYTASVIITPVGGRPVHRVLSQPVHGTATCRCYDTRCCIIQF